MSSPLEDAIQRVSRTGWLIKSLSKSPFNGANSWACELWPAHFGMHYPGKRQKNGMWTVYTNPQATVIGIGNTAFEAVRNALVLLDKSDAKGVYEDLERALEDWLDAIQAARDRR